MRLVFKDWLSVLLSPVEANRLKINLKDENCSSNGYLLIGDSEVEDVSINNCFKSDVFWGKKPTTTCSVSKHNAHDDDDDARTKSKLTCRRRCPLREGEGRVRVGKRHSWKVVRRRAIRARRWERTKAWYTDHQPVSDTQICLKNWLETGKSYHG